MPLKAWWLQAVQLGMVAGVAIWMISTVVALLGSFLVAWGPFTFLHFVGVVGPYLLALLLGITAPFWVIGGLLWLVAHGSAEQGERRVADAEEGARENGGQGVYAGREWGKRFRRRWSRRWVRFEQGIVDWLVLRPALRERSAETEGSGNPYLRTYLKEWVVGSASLCVTLTVIALGSRAKVAPGDTSLEGLLVVETLLECALGVCLGSLLVARYVVTRVLVKQLGIMAAEGGDSLVRRRACPVADVRPSRTDQRSYVEPPPHPE